MENTLLSILIAFIVSIAISLYLNKPKSIKFKRKKINIIDNKKLIEALRRRK